MVGGGVIGCAITAELARAGAKTILIERAEIASGASGRNHGLIWYPQSDITAPLYFESHAIYRRLAAESEVDFMLDGEPRGMLVVVTREDLWELAASEASLAETGGVKVRRLEAEDLEREEPNLAPGLLGGFHIDDGYRLDPAALTLALALQAQAGGAEVITHTDVKQILLRGGKVSGVATDAGIVHAPVVVDAAGPWSAKLARSIGADLAVGGARGWLLLTRAVEPVASRLILTAGWHVTTPDPSELWPTVGGHSVGEAPRSDVGLLIQQNRSGHIMLGGTRVPSIGDMPEGSDSTQRIARLAVTVMPRLRDVHVIAIWSGVRPMSPDDLPLIGWMGEVEGLFVATGHGGQGVILGGGTGRLSAEMILGKTPFTASEAFDPTRFAPAG